jgi:hypothetical protein
MMTLRGAQSAPRLLGIIALAPAPQAWSGRATWSPAARATMRPLADIAFGPGGAYTTEVATTPTIYLSFFGPASPAAILDNTRRLTAPLLWVAGSDDPIQCGGAAYGFAGAPANPLSRYVVVAPFSRSVAR